MHINRLAQEKSPYLLQHAHNPVDWFPWGDEAFEKAAREDKAVFLSIGYSTCHWCHVMERESFENDEIARVLNDNFVSIKVDREERPDVDRIYMMFVQAATGSGGWPMSVFLTPDRKPFFGGTYFPPDNRFGRPGFGAVLTNLARAWKEDRARIEESGAQVLRQLQEYSQVPAGSGAAGKDALESGFFVFRRMFDSTHGGFGGAPKFPRPSVHNFLLRYHAETGSVEALDMVLTTLREMAKGGMNDQLGGGFHRYSVDERWFVPHFEKMLYDQAQLAISYVEAFQITRDGQYAAAARDIFSYVLRDMTHPDGGFYSAEDADSADESGEKREGAFYVWSAEEIDGLLAPGDAEMFRYRFGVGPGGNVQEDPHGEFHGRNILYQAHTVEETALLFKARTEEARAILKSACAKLMEVRGARPRPHLDDKILAAWNGLMISAFAKGAQALDEPRYADAARGAANFVRRRMWDEGRGMLLRRYREDAAIDAFLDDYAFVCLAMLDLYETDFDARDLKFAMMLAERAIALFEDRQNGGFFSSSASGADLVLRLKDDYDGAEPSGNSAMALALLRLGQMTDRADFLRSAERTLEVFGGKLRSAGAQLPQMLVALGFALGQPREIVLAGPRSEKFKAMLGAIRPRFLPSTVILRAEDVARPMPAVGGEATAYVCENYACKLPATTVEQLGEQLQ
jgi:uncharacterized protein YyaL (SSP411 family)